MKTSAVSSTSTFRALRNPVYCRLWLASVVSGTLVSAHDTAATWVVNSLSASTVLLSLMSTVASLPFFLFTLPAGALADMVNRRQLLCFMNVWLSVSAGLLAAFAFAGLLNPYIILAAVFLIGVGFAFNAPAWTAIVPEVVIDEELPSAATLSGLQLNLSGIVGPAVGGFLLPIIGASWVFAINAIGFLLVVATLLAWRPQQRQSQLPLETFFESFATAVRYVRFAPGIQVLLARNVLFTLFICVIPALLPVVGLKGLHLQASSLGLLFTCMGAGSVFGAILVIPWVRSRFRSNQITILANLLLAAVFVLMALVRSQPVFMFTAALAGIAWTIAASELWVAGQRAMPAWARGRMNATVIMVGQGATALGSLIWGVVAANFGLAPTLLAAAALLVISLALAIPLSIDFTQDLKLDPAPVTPGSHKLIHMPQPHDGPVTIAYEFQVDYNRGGEFMELMRDVRLIHLRNGAYSWRLYEDLSRHHTFRIEMTVPSWTEHLLQHERLTVAEKEILDRAAALHAGAASKEERIYLCVNRELAMHRQAPIVISTNPPATVAPRSHGGHGDEVHTAPRRITAEGKGV
ncbi:MAG: MFS transporter [Verrucomicrobia bacterium]|nr:MFS transporter [Verrucomicrobiota bacterium]